MIKTEIAGANVKIQKYPISFDFYTCDTFIQYCVVLFCGFYKG